MRYHVLLVAALSVAISASCFAAPSTAPKEPTETALSGTVLSVETVHGGNPPERKEAVLNLKSGETVRGTVAPSCTVLPGQSVRILRVGHELLKEPVYLVTGAEK